MDMPNPLPRLMNTLELAQPLATFEPALYTWASGSGIRVRSRIDLLTLSNKYAIIGSYPGEISAIDIGIGLDVLDALAKAAPTDRHYQVAWRHLLTAAGTDQDNRFLAIIELQQLFGGILLDAVETPHSIIIPRPSGSYILAGHEDFYILNASPLGTKLNDVSVTHADRIISRERIDRPSALDPPTLFQMSS